MNSVLLVVAGMIVGATLLLLYGMFLRKQEHDTRARPRTTHNAALAEAYEWLLTDPLISAHSLVERSTQRIVGWVYGSSGGEWIASGGASYTTRTAAELHVEQRVARGTT